MIVSVLSKDVPVMNQAAATCVLLKPAGPAGEALQQALDAAGLRVLVVPTVFDVVAEAERAGEALRYLFVGVDFWSPSEFRLLPLVRREWPGVTVVACHSPGFEYKGRVAELVGADAVLCGIDEMVPFAEGLAAAARPDAPREAAPEPAAPAPLAKAEAVSVEIPPPPAPPADKPPASPLQSIPLVQPQPPRPASAPPADRAPPAPPQDAESDVADEPVESGIDGEVIGTIELTEEELRLLLGEDEDA